MTDLIPLDFLVVGNGGSIKFFDWDRLNPDLRVICTNGAWMDLPVAPDCVVSADEHWVIHNKANCPHPLYTREPWSKKHSVACIPDSNTRETTGAMCIRLAAQYGASNIYVIGFDILTHDSAERWHDHKLKQGRIKNVRRFTEDYNSAVEYAHPSWVHLLSGPELWSKCVYK